MKNLLSLGLVFLLSCSHQIHRPASPLSELEAMLSPGDLKIHRCLHSGKELNFELKKECLTGTPYESYISRVPSSEEELIMKNNWFFDSQENIENFYKVSRGYIRMQSKLMSRFGGKLVNKKAIALEGSAFLGVGRGWIAELAVHQNKLGLFCAPTYSLQSDIGVEAELAVSHSLSCLNNDAYAGEDIGFSAALSGELIGLPVGLGVGYSMSINSAAFKQKISEARRSGLLNFNSLKAEVARLNNPEIKRALTRINKYALPLTSMALKTVGLFQIPVPNLSTQKSMGTFVLDMIRNDRSLGLLFKQYYTTRLKSILLSHRLNNLNAVFAALNATVTGCDAVGGSASLGLSLSPVTIGATYANSFLLGEAGAEELVSFAALTPMALLNPFMLGPQDLRNVVKRARTFVAIPTKIQRHCLR